MLVKMFFGRVQPSISCGRSSSLVGAGSRRFVGPAGGFLRTWGQFSGPRSAWDQV